MTLSTRSQPYNPPPASHLPCGESELNPAATRRDGSRKASVGWKADNSVSHMESIPACTVIGCVIAGGCRPRLGAETQCRSGSAGWSHRAQRDHGVRLHPTCWVARARRASAFRVLHACDPFPRVVQQPPHCQHGVRTVCVRLECLGSRCEAVYAFESWRRVVLADVRP